MADNLTTGSTGSTVRTDDVGGIHYQYVKMDGGGDGVSVPLIAGSQADASSLPVALSTESKALLGATNESAAATDTSTSGLNGLFKRLLQRITTLLSVLPSALGANGGLKVEGVASGTEVPVSIAGTVTVTGGGGGTEYTEDAAAAADPVGQMLMAVRADSLAAVTSTNGDNIALRATNNGELYVKHVDAIPVTDNGSTISIDDGGGNISIDDGGNTITVDGTITASNASGDVAHDAADSGNPLKIGAKAASTEPSAVAAADRVNIFADLFGRVITALAPSGDLVSGAITTAMTGTTSTSLLSAPGAGKYNYITQVTVSNAHASVGTDIVLQDGSGGTTFYTIPAAANYGGAVLSFNPPLKQPTSNTALYVANVTTGASTKVSANGYKGA